MNWHILNGDCLREKFPKEIEGEIIVWRETLVSGPLSAKDFFENRKNFIQKRFNGNPADYENRVIKEFERLRTIKKDDAVYFWFEDDLFCQVNFWFLLSQFTQDFPNLYAVLPLVRKEENRWKGFGNLNSEDLQLCFQHSQKILQDDMLLAQKLWKAFSENDFAELQLLGNSKSAIFRKLKRVLEANENLFNGKLAKEISTWEEHDFNSKFERFSKDFGVYGFGDMQFQLFLKENTL